MRPINKTNITNIFIAGLIACFSPLASADGGSSCHEFGVQVLNRTDTECLFMGSRMVHGYLLSVTPTDTVLSPQGTQVFMTQQNLIQGPTIVLNYLCGGKKISIGSHQNFCMFDAGRIDGTVISSDAGIKASYKETIGSYSWSYPGHIYWALELTRHDK